MRPAWSTCLSTGELELLPGVRLLPAPGHTPGTQVVVIGSGDHPVVVAGDVAVWFGELDDPQSEGQRLVRALEPGARLARTHARAVATRHGLTQRERREGARKVWWWRWGRVELPVQNPSSGTSYERVR